MCFYGISFDIVDFSMFFSAKCRIGITKCKVRIAKCRIGMTKCRIVIGKCKVRIAKCVLDCKVSFCFFVLINTLFRASCSIFLASF
jgi:hypothetical protein